MDERALFRSGDRREWRRWLSENYMTAPEIWLVYSTKGSGDECIPYNDSVEEALCFGWIDSTLRRIDPDHYARRFTPRRKNSEYSRANIERLIWLDSRDLICPDVRETVADIISEPFVFPEDIIAELKKDEDVWRNYVSFSESYKRIRVSYIDSARDRPAEFRKRLDNFIKRTRENKKISGYGGIDRYYRSDAGILFRSHTHVRQRRCL